MLGMLGSHPDAAFDDGLAVARRYLQRVGRLAAPQNAVQDGVRIGQWLAISGASDDGRAPRTRARTTGVGPVVEA